MGLLKNKKDMITDMPQGYVHPHRMERTTAPPPAMITYTEKHTYTLRAHIYQGKGPFKNDLTEKNEIF